jgi:hypothetical protein
MRLCGGNINGSFDVPDGLMDEWGASCSLSGADYPTGITPVLGQCNVGLEAGLCASYLHESCGPEDVNSPTGCTSPSGAVHMVGNVSEWVDLCSPPDPDAGTRCQTRGGSFAGNLTDPDETCYNPGNAAMRDPDPTIGFRCCAYLSAAEQALIH